MTVFFENGVANGPNPTENNHTSRGATHVFTSTGNFDGAAVTLQIKSPSDPNGAWTDVVNAILTSASSKFVEFLPNGYEARATISSAGASTDVFAELREA